MKKSFREFLKEQSTVIFDGAMGTELLNRGFSLDFPLEWANVTRPELVKQIHTDYILAGASSIETNTFGANECKLKVFGFENEVERINRSAVRIAKETADDKVYVIGSVGPLGKPVGSGFEIDDRRAKEVYKRQLYFLLDEGVDAIIFETAASTHEVQIAIEALKELNDEIPYIIQFSFTKDLSTIYGEDIYRVIEFLKSTDADVVGLNCGNGPQKTLEALKIFSQNLKGPFSVQPNAGYPQLVQGRLIYSTSAKYFASFVPEYIKLGAKIVGGCCGTTPEHIKAIKEKVKEFLPSIEVEVIERKEEQKAVLKDTPSELSQKLGKKFIFTVEISPPKGIELEKTKEGVKLLKEAGADTVNIADSPMARVRISPIALAHILKEELGMESILHFTCRDRNLISLQSELLGAAALGVKNVLALTGDPPSIGDHPQAKPVFDVNSEGLVLILSRLNSGTDYMGNPIGKATNFTIGVALNLNADDLGKEIEKLKHKIENGAHFIETQPIYEPETLERFFEKVDFKLPPILGGILPLRSSRHAEFLHNEVPGITIPDKIRERMRSSKEPAKEGVEIACEIVEKIKHMVSGIYIMPPFEKYEMAVEIIKNFKY
ncbi:bifunctional homocysteine S-methyltransferase/methylenetetrahydrofolate reductase [Caldicellulosiruptor acetigenus]|uniref:bifunctional homocysteine S-methyltransferase/methylenetetrahydrofolate reductase n=1 Tax=Caldicellulosiruptor acetigenus TaxID=301953 RepID=UPI0003F9D302|nr:bifunctional homocysteine S-methyltransferase/methylenetetrahydrofolate reductase [Caldicellulosiruptor acetigenus]WAM35972.1 bifunctional homocysteine S-methyltransferase/methylenetetrahydrofolate reductase [Caldicellulosiruptor acetigenus]